MAWVPGAMGLSLLQLVKTATRPAAIEVWGSGRSIGCKIRVCVLKSLLTFQKSLPWACYLLFLWDCSLRRVGIGCRHERCT